MLFNVKIILPQVMLFCSRHSRKSEGGLSKFPWLAKVSLIFRNGVWTFSSLWQSLCPTRIEIRWELSRIPARLFQGSVHLHIFFLFMVMSAYLKPDAGAFRALTKSAKIHEGSVSATLNFQHYISVSHLKSKSFTLGDFNACKNVWLIT